MISGLSVPKRIVLITIPIANSNPNTITRMAITRSRGLREEVIVARFHTVLLGIHSCTHSLHRWVRGHMGLWVAQKIPSDVFLQEEHVVLGRTLLPKMLYPVRCAPDDVPSLLHLSISRSRHHNPFRVRRAEPTCLDEFPDALDVLALLLVVAVVVDAEGGAKKGHLGSPSSLMHANLGNFGIAQNTVYTNASSRKNTIAGTPSKLLGDVGFISNQTLTIQNHAIQISIDRITTDVLAIVFTVLHLIGSVIVPVIPTHPRLSTHPAHQQSLV